MRISANICQAQAGVLLQLPIFGGIFGSTVVCVSVLVCRVFLLNLLRLLDDEIHRLVPACRLKTFTAPDERLREAVQALMVCPAV
jgi:hypothetical protein